MRDYSYNYNYNDAAARGPLYAACYPLKTPGPH